MAEFQGLNWFVIWFVMVGFVWSRVAFSENFHVIVLLNSNTMFAISIVIGFDESDIMRLEWKSSLHSREESGGWLGVMHAIDVSLAKLNCVPMYSRCCDADFSLICALCIIYDIIHTNRDCVAICNIICKDCQNESCSKSVHPNKSASLS